MNREIISTLTARRRDLSVDLLKAVAIFGVIIIHTCSYSYDIASFNWTSSVFWGSAVRASVPLFFMCSGALLLRPEIELPMKKLFTKNILRIIVAMLIWAMAYKIFHLLAAHSLSLASLLQAFKEVLLFNQEFHFYFLHIILLVYLFLPVTRIITKYAEKSQLEYLLALWFALGILFPSVISYWPFKLLSSIPLQYKLNMTYSAIGYGLLGYYIKRYPLKKRSWYAISLAIGFIITFGGTCVFSLVKGTFDTQFLEGMSVGVCLMAAGIFGLCVSSRDVENEKLRRVIVYLSKASFCVFLTHVFFVYALSALGIAATILPSIVSTPLIACIILLGSVLIYMVLSRIPIIKDWII